MVSLIIVQPAQPTGLAGYMMVVNGLKWLFAGASLLALAFALAALVARKIRRK